MAQKLIGAILPPPAIMIKDERKVRLITYAHDVERDMYQKANSKEEYYQMLAVKIYKIKKELEEKRKTRLAKEGVNFLPNRENSQVPLANNDKPISKQLIQNLNPALPNTKARGGDPSASNNSSRVSSPCDEMSNSRKSVSEKKMFSKEELHQPLMAVLQKLSSSADAEPFREPVDPKVLNIPDYFDIIKHPMDLSTISRRLHQGMYKSPWGFCDDMWLMFENAWLYNKKNTRVHKQCTKLAELFEKEITPVMRGFHYCCGKKYVFNPQVLCCYGKQLCTIPRDKVYWTYQDRYHFCEKCYSEIEGENVRIGDDPIIPQSMGYLDSAIPKKYFKKKTNDHLEPEPWTACIDCGRKFHSICVLHYDQLSSNGYICSHCLKTSGSRKRDSKYSANKLPDSNLSDHIEKRVNNFLKGKGAGNVTVRMVSNVEKTVEVKQGMRTKFQDQFPESFPYRAKALFVFEEIDGTDVCFFGMHVQEYGTDCSPPNKSYTMAHIWACPPSEGDDYIFHCHPPEQKIPKPKRLQEWYKRMLDKAKKESVVVDYKDIHRMSQEENITSANQLAYFEGDFWPNVLEENIKEIDQEEQERKASAAAEAAGQGSNGTKKTAKKGKMKKNSKSKTNNTRKNKKNPYAGTDLTQRLFATMEKHKEVFFVIRLYSVEEAKEVPDIKDPDLVMSCDLMDGRDAFLTLAREKHFEFSSLRRAKYSTIAMLVELHNQGQDRFVYTCNNCSNHVETRYHCSICDDFDLCLSCYDKFGHEHKMEKLGLDLGNECNGDDKSRNPQESRRLSIQRCVWSLQHACTCPGCDVKSCNKMKWIVQHSKNCKTKNSGCHVCKQLIALCCYHAKTCNDNHCPVPFCSSIKQKLRMQQMQRDQWTRRRMAVMQTSTPAYNNQFVSQEPIQQTVRSQVAYNSMQGGPSRGPPNNIGSKDALKQGRNPHTMQIGMGRGQLRNASPSLISQSPSSLGNNPAVGRQTFTSSENNYQPYRNPVRPDINRNLNRNNDLAVQHMDPSKAPKVMTEQKQKMLQMLQNNYQHSVPNNVNQNPTNSMTGNYVKSAQDPSNQFLPNKQVQLQQQMNKQQIYPGQANPTMQRLNNQPNRQHFQQQQQQQQQSHQMQPPQRQMAAQQFQQPLQQQSRPQGLQHNQIRQVQMPQQQLQASHPTQMISSNPINGNNQIKSGSVMQQQPSGVQQSQRFMTQPVMGQNPRMSQQRVVKGPLHQNVNKTSLNTMTPQQRVMSPTQSTHGPPAGIAQQRNSFQSRNVVSSQQQVISSSQGLIGQNPAVSSRNLSASQQGVLSTPSVPQAPPNVNQRSIIIPPRNFQDRVISPHTSQAGVSQQQSPVMSPRNMHPLPQRVLSPAQSLPASSMVSPQGNVLSPRGLQNHQGKVMSPTQSMPNASVVSPQNHQIRSGAGITPTQQQQVMSPTMANQQAHGAQSALSPRNQSYHSNVMMASPPHISLSPRPAQSYQIGASPIPNKSPASVTHKPNQSPIMQDTNFSMNNVSSLPSTNIASDHLGQDDDPLLSQDHLSQYVM
ncbi:uncharacterized protein TRIADDRAFT_60973 [Trichoplax adhaerens]|uniref:histone acetyltransferase n=1 Tax=Trichoplax adhaerens TaxID=10228 RepID=B3S9N8_TRIAD|nr:hypothetical protein TRIADDRAFT_60973 [Trichoplax adhaerens]EDV20569.1 hypothetical protein TRIADDRAFT_60973 [Trichoplax adhaerens]|eukprot:XP_002116995.1 hypothetical protein TRIADDRAFT_60973 [Trichoplax adhaerens]